jgi:hypothetical protein
MTISVDESPNFERSPEESTHLPAPLVDSFTRTPMLGLMSSALDARRISSSSWKRSMTMNGRRPSFCASNAVST